jgi:hypothetical protein
VAARTVQFVRHFAHIKRAIGHQRKSATSNGKTLLDQLAESCVSIHGSHFSDGKPELGPPEDFQ